MRTTAICMILLLASQAGAAVVCPAECAPVRPAAAHHGHEHHMHAASAATTMSAAQCNKVMVAESLLASANRVPEFALDAPVSPAEKLSFAVAVAQVQSSTAVPPSNSPPKYSVLRI